ncbi:MAG: alkaline phosphatase [Bacteroidia bacterium]|nr:alkaline phosphatase [Bacteroidia bacterium]
MIRKLLLVASYVALCIVSSCRSKTPVAGVEPSANYSKKPKNIILLIGDGMGLAQVSAALFVNNGLPGFEFFKIIGLVQTSSYNDYITDSAAGATALSSGEKTYNGAIGVGFDTLSRTTILELAESNGLSTGLISTCSVTHATPASFFAHTPDREMHSRIANDFYGKGIDFVAGTGKPYFSVSKLTEDGYSVFTGYPLTSMISPGKKTFWFYNDSIHPPKYMNGRGDFLPDATRSAVHSLNSNKKGFFLMVEGSQIDWGGHNNDLPYVISETVDFDHAVKQALDFAVADGNTLVIVTADHETGGLGLMYGDLKTKTIKPDFANTHHSGIMVPVYAYGPGAELFSGIMQNTDIFKKMKFLYGF